MRPRLVPAFLLLASGALLTAPTPSELFGQRKAEVDMDRARALYVSNDPTDHSLGRNFQRDIDQRAVTPRHPRR